MIAALTLLVLAQKPSAVTRTLADGSQIALVAVTSLTAKKSWSPSGAPLREFLAPPALKSLTSSPKSPLGKGVVPRKPSLILVFQVSGGKPADPPSLGFKMGKRLLANSYLLPDAKSGSWWAGAEIPSGVSADIAVGLGVGKWVSTSTHDLQTGLTKGPKFFAGILRDVATSKGKAVSVVDSSLPASLALGFATRIRIYELGGTAPQFLCLAPIWPRGNSRWQFVENDKRVITAELQTRPYRWVTFPRVKTPKA